MPYSVKSMTKGSVPRESLPWIVCQEHHQEYLSYSHWIAGYTNESWPANL